MASRIAALLTGAVVGLAGAVLGYLVMAGCDAVIGTTSCGRSGWPFLVGVLGAMVLLGAALLAAWRLTEALSTSLLAVALVAVLAALLDIAFSGWMFLVLPLLGAAAYAVSHAVTTGVADEPTRRDYELHDIR